MASDILTRRRTAEPAVRQFVERCLRRRLGWGESAVAIEIPTGGARSLLFKVFTEGHRPVVIHAFDKGKDRRRLRCALELAGEHDLPMPRLRHCGWGLPEKLRHGYSFLVAEHIAGEHLPADLPDPRTSQALAAALARLHGVCSTNWGKPGKLARSPIREDWARGVRRRCRELEQGTSGLDAEMLRSIEQGFGKLLASVPEPSQFHLCHHHLAPDDIIYDAATGRLAFIDCSSLQFSRASRDLAAVRHAFFTENDRAWHDFQRLYFSNFPEGFRTDCELEEPFFDAFIQLSKLKHRRSDSTRAESSLARLLSHLTP